jgi:hypothetical protein
VDLVNDAVAGLVYRADDVRDSPPVGGELRVRKSLQAQHFRRSEGGLGGCGASRDQQQTKDA